MKKKNLEIQKNLEKKFIEKKKEREEEVKNLTKKYTEQEMKTCTFAPEIHKINEDSSNTFDPSYLYKSEMEKIKAKMEREVKDLF